MDLEQIEQDHSEYELLAYLTEFGYLEGAADGVARQVMDKGRRSLKGKQAFVFERIAKEYFDLECSRCHITMPTCEVVSALSECDGLCSWCRKMVCNDD